jgi:predicted DNA-binding protein YlxM (UPF0122 family)
MEKNIEISLLLDFYGGLLKPDAAEMIDLYYNEDLSLSEIAVQTGITRQGVRDRIKRCEQTLFELEQKLGMLKRFRQLEQGLDRICDSASLIEKGTDNDSIKNLAAQIKAQAQELKE